MAEPLRALIVDDSKPVRSILAKMLVDLGYECEQAADGQEALLVLGRSRCPRHPHRFLRSL
jgi:CheY-like chemotaxis protein